MAIKINVYEGKKGRIDDYGHDLGLCVSYSHNGESGSAWKLGPARAQWLGLARTKTKEELERLIQGQFKGTGVFNDI